MLSSVLKSDRAIEVNIAIMRTFVQLRGIFASRQELALRLDALEQRYDEQFRGVFEAIKQLMRDDAQPKHPLGFVQDS
jgi:dimeric dUTPase (all-alpha-NTP-PPase superfamily)